MKKYLNIFWLLLIMSNMAFADNYYVKTTTDGGNDANGGTSWATAKATIQGAMNASSLYDYIFVKYGTYTISSEITFPSFNSGRRLTSDDGTHTDWYSAIPDSSQCILQGNGCRIFYSPGSTNSMTIIRGFKISNGNATAEGSYTGSGGGILLIDGGLIIERCWIVGNTGSTSGVGSGGGIAFKQAGGGVSPTVRYCKFENNIASTSSSNEGTGGAVFCDYGHNLTFQNNIVENNTASTNCYGYGGGLFTYTSSTITSNIFSNNYATKSSSASYYGQGGGLDNYAANSTITNNTFYKNATGPNQASPNSFNLGSGIYSTTNTSVTVKNNIFSDHNLSGSDRTAIYSSNADITISYNSFYNNTTKYNSRVTSSTNEVLTDPLFTDAANGNFILQAASSCINVGDPASTVQEGGEPTIDIGAFEFVYTALKSVSGIDGTINDNIIPGVAISIASQSGTIDASAQQFLGDPSNITIGSRHIGKYWDISSITGGNAKIRLYYSNEAVAAFTGTPTIYHYTGSAWESLPTEAAVAVGSCKYVETTNYYPSFSNVTVGDGEAPLPVEITSFTAMLGQNKVVLNWSTASEVNNYGFQVERAIRNEELGIGNWIKVGFLNGSGNSNSPKEYSFTDNTVTSGKNVYRLKQIDNDGKFEYSEEVEVGLGMPAEFSLKQNYPNPFNPTTVISYQLPVNSLVTLKVYDVLGNEVAVLVNEEKQPGVYNYELGIRNYELSSGVYFYQLRTGSFIQTKKMILLK